jgi:hypothetical protein
MKFLIMPPFPRWLTRALHSKLLSPAVIQGQALLTKQRLRSGPACGLVASVTSGIAVRTIRIAEKRINTIVSIIWARRRFSSSSTSVRESGNVVGIGAPPFYTDVALKRGKKTCLPPNAVVFDKIESGEGAVQSRGSDDASQLRSRLCQARKIRIVYFTSAPEGMASPT